MKNVLDQPKSVIHRVCICLVFENLMATIFLMIFDTVSVGTLNSHFIDNLSKNLMRGRILIIYIYYSYNQNNIAINLQKPKDGIF